MNGQEFRGQVLEGYSKINNRWLNIHFHLLVCCTLISGVAESLMFFIIFGTDSLNCPVGEYWLKYVIIPLFMNACVVGIGYLITRKKTISIVAKQYIISLQFVVLAFILQLVHSGLVAVLVVAVFPVLMTIMYENQKMTAIVTICSVIMQAIGGFCIFWDPDKVINTAYLANLIILVIAAGCTWLICKYMIDFMKMKREIILNNDVERFRLQREINMDGLTNVGSKQALLERLDVAAEDLKGVAYLVMLDLDGFKKINDTYGHIVGDDVLRCVGKALLNMKNSVEAYRYGGDEFCVIFTENILEDVIQEVKNVQNYLKKHVKIPDERMSVNMSAGIASYIKGKTTAELQQQADKALYESKKHYGSVISVYKEEETSG